ncbi:dihydrodipicolinate synthase family protein [candidate division KSB1 bacterium]|nr:dihydrodipicolinate synthase family protein [candidate division KSB1 bacterium]
MKLTGLIPATFTPMKEDGLLNLDKVEAIVEHLIADKVSGLFVCGSTGEGASLSVDERMATALAYTSSVNKRLPVIVHVGHDSLVDAKKLAIHAQKIGADVIAAVPPSYFKITSIEILIRCMEQIASVVPELPFYYYNIPSITGANFNMVEFLETAKQHIPNLAGIKHSTPVMNELLACRNLENGKYGVVFGSDEMLLSGLAAGATGAVGSNYNYAAPLYLKIMDAFNRNDIEEAQKYQSLSVKKVRYLFKYRGLPAIKSMMKMIGLDCGPVRLPLQALTTDEYNELEKSMNEIGFFEWGRK